MSEHISATPSPSWAPQIQIHPPHSSHFQQLKSCQVVVFFLKATYFQNCFSTSRSVISLPKHPSGAEPRTGNMFPQEQGELYVSIPIAPVTIRAGIFHPRRRRESKLPVGCAELSLSPGSQPGTVIREERKKLFSAGLQELMAPFNALSLYASVSNPVFSTAAVT